MHPFFTDPKSKLRNEKLLGIIEKIETMDDNFTDLICKHALDIPEAKPVRKRNNNREKIHHRTNTVKSVHENTFFKQA